MIAVAVLLEVGTLSMLAGVLEYKSIKGYPGAVHALDEAIWLDVLGGVRVRDRIMPGCVLGIGSWPFPRADPAAVAYRVGRSI